MAALRKSGESDTGFEESEEMMTCFYFPPSPPSLFPLYLPVSPLPLQSPPSSSYSRCLGKVKTRKKMKLELQFHWRISYKLSQCVLKMPHSISKLLGFGGFNRVYKGTLPNPNTRVAVKRISHDSKLGLCKFASEISSIGRLRHWNLVQLLGRGRKGEDLLLVYDYMANGSLDKYIFDEPRSVLSWEQRVKIMKGVASGLLYLHEGWEETVIHRDIKSGNELLRFRILISIVVRNRVRAVTFGFRMRPKSKFTN